MLTTKLQNSISVLTTLSLVSLTSLSFAQYDAPTGYYSSAQGLTGTSLKNALHNIIDDHTKFSYSTCWTILREIDEHPTQSDSILTIYSNEPIKKTDQNGSTSASLNWNREHSWPKSYGFNTTSWPAYTDVHHLRASRSNYNSARGNKPFDNGGSSVWTAFNTSSNNLTDSNSWEPHDNVKGDLARSMFYMDVRYNGDKSNEPDLQLVDTVSISTGQPLMGKLSTLLSWHNSDPVSTREEKRNHLIYTNWQGNRNPFIDEPTYACDIWGSTCSGGGGGGSTPDAIVSATFENTLGWSNTGAYNWSRDSSGTPSSGTGPNTGANGSSYYAYVETSSGSAYSAGNEAILESSAFTGSSRVLSFEYHMYGSNMGTLRAEVLVNGGQWTAVSTISGQQQTSNGAAYLTRTVDLSGYGSQAIKVRFRYTAAGGYRGDVAIDDVYITGSGGSIGGTVNEGSTGGGGGSTSGEVDLTFESGFGDWTNGGSEGFTRRSGSTPSSSTGPSSASGGSYYAYMETSSGYAYSSGNDAILTSPQFDLSSNTNLAFDYHMYGGNIGTLRLEKSTNGGSSWTTIWSQSGDKGNSWNAGNVEIFSGSNITLRFRATAVGGWQGDIAIDNIDLGGSSSGGGGGGSTGPTTLLNTSNSVTQGQWRHYTVNIPSGTSSLDIVMTGNGDADLYAKDSSQPTLSSYDYRPWLNGSNETINVSNPSAGTYYISVYGYASGTSSFSLTATAN